MIETTLKITGCILGEFHIVHTFFGTYLYYIEGGNAYFLQCEVLIREALVNILEIYLMEYRPIGELAKFRVLANIAVELRFRYFGQELFFCFFRDYSLNKLVVQHIDFHGFHTKLLL